MNVKQDSQTVNKCISKDNVKKKNPYFMFSLYSLSYTSVYLLTQVLFLDFFGLYFTVPYSGLTENRVKLVK